MIKDEIEERGEIQGRGEGNKRGDKRVYEIYIYEYERGGMTVIPPGV